jgi:large subunit ribosomal protein L44e
MERPRKVQRYCRHCKKHTEQELERVKKRKASELKWGQRRFRRATRGYTGFPRPKPEGREKPTRKINLTSRCTVCKKKWSMIGIRSKKFELKEQ